MSGKFIVNAVAIVGWLIASLVAFVTVVLFGFLGVGFLGLLILFIATQFELDSDAAVSGGINSDLLARQVRAQRETSREQQMAGRSEKALQVLSVRFFKYFGSGLALIGFGGFVCYQI
jgi:hypothetical protein